MSPSRPTLRAFLATAKAALSSPSSSSHVKPPGLSFVVGNEAADLDSLCSSILLAYVRTHQSPPPAPQTLHIPLANIPRPDFSLRPEFAGVLHHVGLTADDIPSLSDIFTPDGKLVPVLEDAENNGSGTRWLLVDHNTLTGPLKELFSRRIVGCLDHHVDEGHVPEHCGDEPRVIEVVGSCATLVCEYARPAWEERMAKNENGGEGIDAQLARLALAPVLVDTAGFTNPYKTTPRDISAAEFLEATLRRFPNADAAKGYDRQAYIDELRALESDLSGMSVRDMLRKDYKQWEDCGCVMGVSAVVQPFAYMIERASDTGAFLDAARVWGTEKGLDMVVVMTITKPADELQRELLVWGVTEKGARSAREFAKRSAEHLQLSVWGEGELCEGEEEGKGEWRRGWKQGNVSQSRKQVGPLLREAVRTALG